MKEPIRKEQILKERAHKISQPATALISRSQGLPVVTIRLGEETYAFPQKNVIEVCNVSEITALPGAPAHFLGVFNFRGDVLCLLNLKRFLNLFEKGISDFRKIVVLTDGRTDIGILADAIIDETTILETDLLPLPSAEASQIAPFSPGVTHIWMHCVECRKASCGQAYSDK